MNAYANNEETVKIFEDAGIHCVKFNIMTASGPAPFTKVCQTIAEAEELKAKLIADSTIGTNGYERHTAAFV